MYSEKTLRRRAYKIGYQVLKGYQHQQAGRAICRDCYGVPYTGFMVKDLTTGSMYGIYPSNDFELTLEDVEAFLKEKYEECGLTW